MAFIVPWRVLPVAVVAALLVLDLVPAFVPSHPVPRYPQQQNHQQQHLHSKHRMPWLLQEQPNNDSAVPSVKETTTTPASVPASESSAGSEPVTPPKESKHEATKATTPPVIVSSNADEKPVEDQEETEEPTPAPPEPLDVLMPIFDFKDSNRNETDRFDRIDDVIMGGISSSTLRQFPGDSFARWSGVCRIDGGGFCGVRTLPFQKRLEIFYGEGFYLKCRLTSDDEPERRVWKMTTRSKKSRDEQLYQAEFTIPKTATPTTRNNNVDNSNEWCNVKIPFEDFRLVKGPRLVKNAPPLDKFGGICQIGLILSKFVMSHNMTMLENFRPGFFELQIQEIGVYSTGVMKLSNELPTVESLTKDEAKAQQPLIMKILIPLSKVFFTENSQRRKSAMRILKEDRGLSHVRAILFGIQRRAQRVGLVRSILRAVSIMFVDSIRMLARLTVRYAIFLPMRLINKTMTVLKFLPQKEDLGEA